MVRLTDGLWHKGTVVLGSGEHAHTFTLAKPAVTCVGKVAAHMNVKITSVTRGKHCVSLRMNLVDLSLVCKYVDFRLF